MPQSFTDFLAEEQDLKEPSFSSFLNEIQAVQAVQAGPSSIRPDSDLANDALSRTGLSVRPLAPPPIPSSLRPTSAPVPNPPAGKQIGSVDILAEEPQRSPSPAIVRPSLNRPMTDVQEGPRPFAQRFSEFGGHAAGQFGKLARAGAKLTAQGQGVTSTGAHLSSDERQALREPVVKPSILVPDPPPDRGVTQPIEDAALRLAYPAAKGAIEGAEALTSPEMVGTIAATGGLGTVARATSGIAGAGLRAGVSALGTYFTAEMAKATVEGASQAKEALDRGDYESAAQALGYTGVSGFLAARGIQHTAQAARGAVEGFRRGYERGRERREIQDREAAWQAEQLRRKAAEMQAEMDRDATSRTERIKQPDRQLTEPAPPMADPIATAPPSPVSGPPLSSSLTDRRTSVNISNEPPAHVTGSPGVRMPRMPDLPPSFASGRHNPLPTPPMAPPLPTELPQPVPVVTGTVSGAPISGAQGTAGEMDSSQLPTIPERPETIGIQLDQLANGTRRVVMIPKEVPLESPPRIPGMSSGVIDGNLFVYDPNQISGKEIAQAARENRLPEVLGAGDGGLGAPDKSEIAARAEQGVEAAQEPVGVTAETADGVPVQDALVPRDEESIGRAVEQAEKVTPVGGKVEVKEPGEVIGERLEPSADRHDELFRQIDAMRKDPLYRERTYEAGRFRDRIIDLERELEFHRPAAIKKAEEEIAAEEVKREQEAQRQQQKPVTAEGKPYVDPYELAEHYKAKGIDRHRAWDEFVKDTILLPRVRSAKIDAKDFFKAYDSVQPKISDKLEPKSSIAKEPEGKNVINRGTPRQGTPERFKLDADDISLVEQYDKLSEQERTLRKQYDDAKYGTKKRDQLEQKWQKARDAADGVRKQLDPIRKQTYLAKLEDAVEQTENPILQWAAATKYYVGPERYQHAVQKIREHVTPLIEKVAAEEGHEVSLSSEDAIEATKNAISRAVQNYTNYPLTASTQAEIDKYIRGAVYGQRMEIYRQRAIAKVDAIEQQLKEEGLLHSSRLGDISRQIRDAYDPKRVDEHVKSVEDLAQGFREQKEGEKKAAQEAVIERSREVRPLSELRAPAVTSVWNGNVFKPGDRFASDGHMMFDTTAFTNKRIQDAANRPHLQGAGSLNPVNGEKVWNLAVEGATQDLEILGYRPQQGVSFVYLTNQKGDVLATRAEQLRWIQAVTGFDSIKSKIKRGEKGLQTIVFFKDGKPIAIQTLWGDISKIGIDVATVRETLKGIEPKDDPEPPNEGGGTKRKGTGKTKSSLSFDSGAGSEPAKPPREFASTQIDLDPATSKAMADIARTIDPADLAEDGIETDSHVTVKFGLHADTPKEVQQLLSSESPIRLKMGKVSLFQNPDADVLKVEIDSPDLHRLNKKLSSLPHTDTHPDYKPHATIAYLKPGKGQKYVDRIGDHFAGREVSSGAITFSGKDRMKVRVPLGSSERGSTPVDFLPGVQFAQEDVIPAVKEGLANLQSAWDSVKKVLTPQLRSPEAAQSGLTVREHASDQAIRFDRAEHALKQARKMFRQQPNESNLNFISRMESGQTQPTPELQIIADTMRGILDGRRDDVRALGTRKLQTFIQNYFPHIWKNPETAADVLMSLSAKRPLEGSKSFLKKRSIPTISEGIEAGLEPVSYNPVDLVLMKVREVDKYVMAQRVLKELKSQGLVKYVPAKKIHQARKVGYKLIDDKISTVYGSGKYKVSEAFDQHVMNRLEGLAKSLGIKHDRELNIGGARGAWGLAYKGQDRIKTKFGGPESVLAHEIGHQLEWRYKIHDLLRKFEDGDIGKKIRQELKDLADLRVEGMRNVPKSYITYIRNKDEKIANVIAALIYMPERFQEIAPETWDALHWELGKHKELDPLFEIKPSMVLGSRTTEGQIYGQVINGYYMAPEKVADLINNYLSPGLRGSGMFRAYLGSANVLNQFQLGLSFFHFGMTSIDATVSRLALGIYQASQGKPVQGLKTAASTPVAAFTNLIKGHKVLKEWFSPGGQGAEIAAIVDAAVAGGARAKMDDFYHTKMTERMMEAFRAGSFRGVAFRVPFAVMEQATKPLMEWLVPRQKMGVFADLARFELERLGPNATREDVRKAMARAWDSVDNRMGQLVYDNLFWDKVAKDLAMASVRSVGWNLGTIRELGGGGIDAIKLIGKGVRGKATSTDVSLKLTYLLALPVVTGILSAIMQYLMGGGLPTDKKDYAFPKTGNLDEHGRPERFSLPSYVKDLYHYSIEPGKTIQNKLHPMISLVAEMLTNQDYYGTEIRNEDDPLIQQLKDMAKHVGQSFKPFAVQGLEREVDLGAEPSKKILPFIGITPAPASLNKTHAEELISKFVTDKAPRGSRTRKHNERFRLMGKLTRDLRLGQDIDAKFAEGVEKGILSPDDRKSIEDRASKTPLENQMARLSLQQAIQVYEAANARERADLRPIMLKKIAGAGGKPYEVKPDTPERLDKLGLPQVPLSREEGRRQMREMSPRRPRSGSRLGSPRRSTPKRPTRPIAGAGLPGTERRAPVVPGWWRGASSAVRG